MTAPDTGAMSREVNALVVRASEFQVVDTATYEEALRWQREARLSGKRVTALFVEPKRAANHAVDVLRAAERSLLDPLKKVDDLFGGKAMAYRRQQELARQAEKKRLEDEQRERARKAAEFAKAEAEKARKAEEDRRLAEAQKWQDEGMPEIADQILADSPAVAAPAPVVQVEVPVVLPDAVPKVAGSSYRVDWSAEVVDLLELVKAVAAGTQPLDLLLPNMPELNRRARALKSELAIPGVEAASKEVTVIR